MHARMESRLSRGAAAASLLYVLASAPPAAAQPAVETPPPPVRETPTPGPAPSAEPQRTPEPEPSPAADEPEARDLGAEIDALRSEVERLREAVEPEIPAEGEPPRTGLKPADLAARAPGTLRLGGVATGAAIVAEEEDAQFAVPRAALFAFAPVGDRVSFAGEVTVLGGGAELVDADRGMPGRGDVFLQYAAVDFVLVPELLALRGGIVLVPLGRTNLLPDESVEDLLVRPAEALYVVPTPWSDVGGGVTGGAYLGSALLSWQAYVLSGPSAGIDARTGFRGARQPPGADANSDKAFAGRVTLEPAAGIELGVSAYTGAYSRGGGRRATLVALDAALDAGPILLEGEALQARTDGGIGSLGLPIPESLFGGSTRLTWRFLPDVLGAVLPAPLQGASLGASVRYSFADTDGENPDRVAGATDPQAYTRRDRLSVGVSFRPVPRYVMRAEYEFRTEAGSDLVDDDRAVFSATAAF